MQSHAVIFDMDGLLIDSEPIWEEAGTAVLAGYGCKLTHDAYIRTTGLRTREWLEFWFSYFGVSQFDLTEAEEQILQRVIEGVKARGKAMPGTEYIFDYFRQRQFRIGLATSSSLRVAEVVIAKLGIGKYLQAICSAEFLEFGKPHPQVYLECARQLEVDPLHTLCFEDSFNGLIAAKAAKMKCVIVPAFAQRNFAGWGAADCRISSLQNFNDLLLRQL